MTRTEIAIVIYGLSDNWLGGVNYYRNLVSVFDGAADETLRLHVLTNDAGFFKDMALSPRVRVHRVPMLEHRKPAWWLRKLLVKTLRRDVMLVRELQRLSVTAVVFSHVAGASAAGMRCLPWVPDFQSQRHPEYFSGETAAIERARALAWLADGDGLVVSSAAARDDAVALLNADPSRLHVLRFAPKLDGQVLASATLRDAVFARYGIDRPYLMLPNQYWQHKNHGLVVAALQALRQQGLPLPLVVSTGKTEDLRRPAYFAEFEASLRAAGLGNAYRVLGVIDRQDMLVLLAHSVLVLNPSRFEGWSTSVEEAKALGKPVWVSDIAVHREQTAELLARGHVDFFGVDDVQALSTLLARAPTLGQPDAYPPLPQPAVYKGFERQFMALLRSFAISREVASP